MTNLLTEPLPDNVTIHRRRYKINTDFRMMVRLEWLLTEEPESDERDNALLSLFCELLPDIERLSRTVPAAEITEAVLSFYRHGQPPEQPDGEDGEQESTDRVYSFLHDSAYIYAAFMQAYHMDLTTASLHWYQFRALLSALPQDCLFSRIIDYRGTDLADVPDGQKDFYRKMKRRYALPLPRSEQEKNDAITAALMNGGDLTGVL